MKRQAVRQARRGHPASRARHLSGRLRRAALAQEPQEEVVDPQHVFETLDGTELLASQHPWRLAVFSVFDQADYRWMQVALERASVRHMLTLRLEPGAGPQAVVSGLSSWLHHLEERCGQALNVA